MARWMPWVTSGVVGCLADARTCASDMSRRTASLVDGEIGWSGECDVHTCLCRRRRRRGGVQETLPYMEATRKAKRVGGVNVFPEKAGVVLLAVRLKSAIDNVPKSQNSGRPAILNDGQRI